MAYKVEEAARTSLHLMRPYATQAAAQCDPACNPYCVYVKVEEVCLYSHALHTRYRVITPTGGGGGLPLLARTAHPLPCYHPY
eukprot:scaffold119265_cov33-Phaeocystis_antarctica.AAC.1